MPKKALTKLRVAERKMKKALNLKGNLSITLPSLALNRLYTSFLPPSWHPAFFPFPSLSFFRETRLLLEQS